MCLHHLPRFQMTFLLPVNLITNLIMLQINYILGSFAEREHRKWSQSTVLMPNNPYTMESAMMRKYSKNLGTFSGNNG